MRRLLNVLLILLLAIPAARGEAHAAETPPPVMQMAMTGSHTHHEHGHEHETPASGHEARHECIGCIAPIDVGRYRPVRPAGVSFARTSLPADAGTLRAHAPSPETPPPRNRA